MIEVARRMERPLVNDVRAALAAGLEAGRSGKLRAADRGSAAASFPT